MLIAAPKAEAIVFEPRFPEVIEEQVLGAHAEHRSNVLMLETCETTANAGHLELDVRNQSGEHQEIIHIALDDGQRERVPDGAVLGWDRIALACDAHAITPAGTTIDECEPSRTGTVDATEIRTETRTPSNDYSWCYSFLFGFGDCLGGSDSESVTHHKMRPAFDFRFHH